MKPSVDAFYVFYLNESQIFVSGQIHVVIYVYIAHTHTHVWFGNSSPLQRSITSHCSAVSSVRVLLLKNKSLLAEEGRFVTVVSLDTQEVMHSTCWVYLPSTWLLRLLALLSAPEGKQRFWCVPMYLSLFSENIFLSRPKMSLKSWALEDTFVRQHTHEWGDQLFYF